MSFPPASPRFRRARQASPDGGRVVFRLTAPVVIWWIWLVFAVANVIDLGVQAPPRFAAMVSVVLLTITGVAYACAFRPRVVADEAGLLVVNPVRQWRVPWGTIRQIEVRDWVRIQCARAPGGDATKTIECWALFATARVKRNYSRRAQDHITQSADTARMPDAARRLMSLPAVVIIARQLERRAGQAQAHGATDEGATNERATNERATNERATDERVITSWAWPSIAAMLLPVAALLIVLLTRLYPPPRRSRRGARYRPNEPGLGPVSGRCVGEVPPRGHGAHAGGSGGSPPGPAQRRGGFRGVAPRASTKKCGRGGPGPRRAGPR